MVKATDPPVQRTRGKIDPQGRLLIPAELRRQLEIEPGDRVVLRIVDGELLVTSIRAGIRRAQALNRKYGDPSRSLSEELIRERREEHARELAKERAEAEALAREKAR